MCSNPNPSPNPNYQCCLSSSSLEPVPETLICSPPPQHQCCGIRSGSRHRSHLWSVCFLTDYISPLLRLTTERRWSTRFQCFLPRPFLLSLPTRCALPRPFQLSTRFLHKGFRVAYLPLPSTEFNAVAKSGFL